MIHLIIGGARSGKSSYAERTVIELHQTRNLNPVYLATATAFDHEMENRIAIHQSDRENHGIKWQLIECKRDLSTEISKMKAQDVYLIDCLTLWLNNVMYQYQGRTDLESRLNDAVKALVAELSQCKQHVVIVSNEVGCGITPIGEISRVFVDHAGWLNQAVARVADKVTLVTAGLPLQLKPALT